ncbi:unnamed protein product [Plutella xylostella]|uniref:(diamondback moth) hypothetical protein n=1 Tax=Plutella xylostella TaxID=51655 RepID=A0A8S4G3H5_PLUXY|nr:unnamed protein product [Plutella xylostella]
MKLFPCVSVRDGLKGEEQRFSSRKVAFSTSYLMSCFTMRQCTAPPGPATCSYQNRMWRRVFSGSV